MSQDIEKIVKINEKQIIKKLVLKENKKKKSDQVLANTSSRFLFSISGKGNLREYYLNMIKSAKESIFIINWLFVNNINKGNKHKKSDIIIPLMEAIKRLKGKVFIITASKNPRFNQEEKKYYDTHLDILSKLEKCGAFIKGYENAHAKLLIIDEKRALLTSANYTTASMYHNIEIGLAIDNPNQVSVLSKTFKYGVQLCAKNLKYNTSWDVSESKTYRFQKTVEMNYHQYFAH